MLALPAKGDSPGTLGDLDSSETTHGSQGSSVSIEQEQGCHGAALALCQSILASED